MTVGQDEKTLPPWQKAAVAAPADVEVAGLQSSRQRRRPLVLVACVAMVVLGALLAVIAFNASTSTSDVLAVREPLAKGEVIEEGDLRSVPLSVDANVSTVPAEEAGRRVVGHRAAVDMPKGSLVTKESITEGLVPRAGDSVVGVTLPISQLPGQPLEVGDQVRIVDAPGVNAGAAGQGSEGKSNSAEGEPAEVQVEVAGVRPAGDRTTVSVIVKSEQAGPLAARAATGRVVIVLDSRER